MRLYHDLHAPNPRRVRVFLAEKSVAYDTIEVSIADKAHLEGAFLAMNPLGLLPVMEFDDGRRLRESIAICRYVEELHPEPNLMGRDGWERAEIEMWNRHAELELLGPISQVFRNTHAFWQGRIDQAPEFGAIMRAQVAERFTWLDRELGGRAHLAGDRFTIADITAMCAIDFGKPSKIRIDASTHPHLAAWYQRVASRPSAKA